MGSVWTHGRYRTALKMAKSAQVVSILSLCHSLCLQSACFLGAVVVHSTCTLDRLCCAVCHSHSSEHLLPLPATQELKAWHNKTNLAIDFSNFLATWYSYSNVGHGTGVTRSQPSNSELAEDPSFVAERIMLRITERHNHQKRMERWREYGAGPSAYPI